MTADRTTNAGLLHALDRAVRAVPRLLAIQDRDPHSPSLGCFHPAWWRDKTADVADLRRQEAVLTLALVHRHGFPENPWKGDREVLRAALVGLRFWVRSQHRDGTFDEWYPNEHGYATTAFSGFAIAEALRTLGPDVPSALCGQVRAALRRAGEWLVRRDDFFKTNHEAVGVAALAAIGAGLGEPRFTAAAAEKLARILAVQSDEGWFPEISGLDPGYVFLLVEYLALHAARTGDATAREQIVKAYRFAADLLHPDLEVGPEYGICRNPYFSRLATVLLARHSGLARGVLAFMAESAGSAHALEVFLGDDLRLCRNAYHPLIAWLAAGDEWPRADGGEPPPPHPPLFARPGDDAWYPKAGLLAVSRPDFYAVAASCAGGLVRAFFRRDGGFHPAVADCGFALAPGRTVFRNAHYALDNRTERSADGILTVAPLRGARFVRPPWAARVLLRVATSLPGGHRASRWLIDIYRRRRGTAINQSAAGIAGGTAPVVLERRVAFSLDQIHITDVLEASRGTLDPAALFLQLLGPVTVNGSLSPDEAGCLPLAALRGRVPAGARRVTIRKRLSLVGARPALDAEIGT